MKNYLKIISIILIFSALLFLVLKPMFYAEQSTSVQIIENSFNPKLDNTNYKIFKNIKTETLTKNKYTHILYKYLQDDVKQYTYSDINGNEKPYKIDKELIWAVGFDIDSDTENEIIGQYLGQPYSGMQFGLLFILKKHNGGYKAIYEEEQVVNIPEIQFAKNIKNNQNALILTLFETYQEKFAHTVIEIKPD